MILPSDMNTILSDISAASALDGQAMSALGTIRVHNTSDTGTEWVVKPDIPRWVSAPKLGLVSSMFTERVYHKKPLKFNFVFAINSAQYVRKWGWERGGARILKF